MKDTWVPRRYPWWWFLPFARPSAPISSGGTLDLPRCIAKWLCSSCGCSWRLRSIWGRWGGSAFWVHRSLRRAILRAFCFWGTPVIRFWWRPLRLSYLLSTCDLVVRAIHLREVALAEQIWKLEDVVLDLFINRGFLAAALLYHHLLYSQLKKLSANQNIKCQYTSIDSVFSLSRVQAIR